MLTEKDLQFIEENLGADWRSKVELLLNEATRGKQLEAELTSNLQKIMLNPETKKDFKNLLDKAGIKEVPIPDLPIDNYYDKTEKIEKEVKNLKNIMEEKEKILKAIKDYGIEDEEIDELIKFQKENAIQDNLKAIELYSKFKKVKPYYEIEPVKKINLTPPENWTEEEAYRKTLDELNKVFLRR